MRTSPDYYQLIDTGEVVAVWQDTQPPRDSVLIYGYDYRAQKWITSGRELVKKLIKNLGQIKVLKVEQK